MGYYTAQSISAAGVKIHAHTYNRLIHSRDAIYRVRGAIVHNIAAPRLMGGGAVSGHSPRSYPVNHDVAALRLSGMRAVWVRLVMVVGR